MRPNWVHPVFTPPLPPPTSLPPSSPAHAPSVSNLTHPDLISAALPTNHGIVLHHDTSLAPKLTLPSIFDDDFLQSVLHSVHNPLPDPSFSLKTVDFTPPDDILHGSPSPTPISSLCIIKPSRLPHLTSTLGLSCDLISNQPSVLPENVPLPHSPSSANTPLHPTFPPVPIPLDSSPSQTSCASSSDSDSRPRSEPDLSSSISDPDTLDFINFVGPSCPGSIGTARSSQIASARLDPIIAERADADADTQPTLRAPVKHLTLVPLFLAQPVLTPALQPGISIATSQPTTPNRPDLEPVSLGSRFSFNSTTASGSQLAYVTPTPRVLKSILNPIPACHLTEKYQNTGLGQAVPRPRPRPPNPIAHKEMHADHYCCFAIPLYNVGIYVILAQFTVFGLVSGILAFSTPSILAIAVSQSLTAIFGVLCILIGLAQAIGFYGVYKERVAFFRKYIIFNAILVFITLVYSLIVIVLSATHHQRAIEQCILQFVSNDDNLATVSASGRTICNIWTWAQLGVCGLLWVLFCASEIYFIILERRWGKDQKIDHLKYRSIVSAARESMAISVFDEGSTPRRSHVRGASSVSTIGSNRPLNAQPAKSSRLRNEIEWKELNNELEPIKKDQAEEVGKWVEGGTGLSDAEFYRAATPRTRVGTATSHSSASSMATKSILKPTIR